MICQTLSASAGFDPLTGRSAPGPRWALSPQTHIIGSCYRACHASFFQFQSSNQSKHICIVPYVVNESEAHISVSDSVYYTVGVLYNNFSACKPDQNAM